MQGNPVWNGTIINGASIGYSNIYCNPTPPVFILCNQYLNVQNTKSGVTIGDLDVSGNQLTVEAIYNRTTSYNPSYQGGDLISKHRDPSDVNYLLRPKAAAITTNQGFFQVTVPCDFNLNTTYHVAMVYDGSSLKFYRNGYLVAQTAASGSLVNNNWPTRIGAEGYLQTTLPTDFIGYISEVKIWSVARTQNQIQNTMFWALPSPTTQPGLLAYYTFNSLQNLQGNPFWNGTLFGSASINQTNSASNGCHIDNGDNCNTWLTRTVRSNLNVIDIEQNHDNVILFPNPAKESVKVRFNADKDAIIYIKIINALGKIVSTQKFSIFRGVNTIILDKNRLTNGSYIVQFELDKKIITRKFIIN